MPTLCLVLVVLGMEPKLDANQVSPLSPAHQEEYLSHSDLQPSASAVLLLYLPCYSQGSVRHASTDPLLWSLCLSSVFMPSTCPLGCLLSLQHFIITIHPCHQHNSSSSNSCLPSDTIFPGVCQVSCSGQLLLLAWDSRL